MKFTTFMMMLLATMFSFTMMGCPDDDDSVEDAVEDAGDEIEDAVEDAGDEVEDAAEDAKDDVEDATDG